MSTLAGRCSGSFNHTGLPHVPWTFWAHFCLGIFVLGGLWVWKDLWFYFMHSSPCSKAISTETEMTILSHLPSSCILPSSQFLILSSYDMFLQSVFPYVSDYVVHLMACCFISWPRTQAPWIQRPCVVQSALYPGTCLCAWLTGVLGTTFRGMAILSFIL